MLQKELLNAIAKKIPNSKSLIEEIASVLCCSYGAAHRRVLDKVKFTFDEAVLLSRHFNISLDLLFNVGEKDVLTVRKTEILKGVEDFENYYKRSIESLTPLLSIPGAQMIYCAKDLPIFYTSGDNYLSRFKLFVWIKILDPTFNIPKFSEFHLPKSLREAQLEFGNLYRNLNTVEIWDVTTINSTLKQLHNYLQSKKIATNEALIVCNDLKDAVKDIYKKVVPDSNYKLYLNELLLMTNNVLIKTPVQNSLFVPFTVLNYFNTNDSVTCRQVSNFLDDQMNQSKLLNTSGEKEKDIFFNKIFEKIDDLKAHIEGQKTLDF